MQLASEEIDPIRRMALVVVATLSGLHTMKYRKRKPFNPMLGETYELVTSNYRFFAEKIEHLPKQVFCYMLEGKAYTL
jgi:hypothetical protein